MPFDICFLRPFEDSHTGELRAVVADNGIWSVRLHVFFRRRDAVLIYAGFERDWHPAALQLGGMVWKTNQK